MITFTSLGEHGQFGNQLFQISAVISTALKNNMSFQLPEWSYQKYFKNKLNLLNIPTDNFK